MRNQYLTKGYLVFRGIFPPSLLVDLRHQADVARNLAHKLIRPLSQYGEKLTSNFSKTTSNYPYSKMWSKNSSAPDTPMATYT